MIHVVNKHKHQPTDLDIYIGRGSALGNPFTGSKKLAHTKATYQCASREEAISRYRDWLMPRIDPKSQTADPKAIALMEQIRTKAAHGDVYLVCFCAPAACHGEIIKQLIEQGQ